MPYKKNKTAVGNSELTYIQSGYLAGKEGLLAGEKLHLDLKRMELAYHELNQREYEMTRHVSVLQLDPLALLRLRVKGSCTVQIPEALFDLDGPGHYFRRIKSVAVSIPSVVGPYTGVNCKLTLLKSSIRNTPALAEGEYRREGPDDGRFKDYFGSLQSVVTSSAQNDSGMFETNLRDERYLPFEGSGAVSEWRLELPADPSQDEPRLFDYNSIADVILHLRYSAREGGDLLRSAAKADLNTLINDGDYPGNVRMFSVRHEFPAAWARFKSQNPDAANRFDLTLDIDERHYPFWSQGKLGSVDRMDVLTSGPTSVGPKDANPLDPANLLDPIVLAKVDDSDKLWSGTLTEELPDKPTDPIELSFGEKNLDDIWIAVQWSGP